MIFRLLPLSGPSASPAMDDVQSMKALAATAYRRRQNSMIHGAALAN
jgi:hypothetical protein